MEIHVTRWMPWFLSFATLFLIASTAKADDLQQGKKLFEGKCARCHGKDGLGNPKMAPNLKVDASQLNLHRDEVVHKSVFEIETMVDSGDHKMPKYRGRLTDTQIHQVALYLKQLTGNASAKDEAVTAK
jgi:mono/diheme cytochrome c family protein